MDDFGTILFLIISGVIALATLVAYRIHAVQKHNKAMIAEYHDAYNDALDYLAAHPADPTVRVTCVEIGRVYYAASIPDTFTAVIGTNAFGTQDYQNNTAGREARIAADIEARIGHLKTKGAAGR